MIVSMYFSMYVGKMKKLYPNRLESSSLTELLLPKSVYRNSVPETLLLEFPYQNSLAGILLPKSSDRISKSENQNFFFFHISKVLQIARILHKSLLSCISKMSRKIWPDWYSNSQSFGRAAPSLKILVQLMSCTRI